MQVGRQRQGGFMMMVVIVVIMMIALTALVSMTGDLVAGAGRRFSATNDTLSRIQKAVVGFAATYQRLPCPAAPTGATNPGWPDDVSPLALPASSTCAFPNGVVPWNALGLSQEQATDEWGRLISYRVYDGAVGLTQDGGASAINCDTDNLTTPRVEPTAAGLCNTVNNKHDTLRSDFITYTSFGTTPSFDKGLNVHDFGPTPAVANVPNVAFVLISHGPSGAGGYLPNGIQMTMPAADARDFANTRAAPAFFISQGASSADIAAGTTGHYDDVVSYLKIADLLIQAKQDARDWPEEQAPSFTAVTTANMTSPSTDATAPHFMSTGGTIPGQAFTPTDATGTAVQAGTAAGAYSACLWWPSKLTLVSETSRQALTTYVEFAAIDNVNDSFPGFAVGILAGTSSVSTQGSGSTGASTITVVSTSGLSIGMTVLGTGIANGATVTGVSGATVTLSAANTAIVSGTITFGGPTNVTCGTNSVATVTATGAAGQNILTVSSGNTASIAVGMNAFGDGIPFDSTVSGVTGSGPGATIQISQNTLNDVAGSVTFATSRQIRRDIGWAGGTLASYADRFAVEFDATRDIGTAGPPAVLTASDPVRPHLAIDRGGVTHGTDAGSCATTGTGLECDSEITNFPIVTKSASGSAGMSAITITPATDMYGILHGMTVSGTGIPASTTVTALSGNLVTLSQALTGAVTAATFSSSAFGSFSSSNFMQNGLSVFHGARVEIYPRDCSAPVATGASGATTVTVTDASQIQSGMAVYGSGIGVGATVVGSFQVNLTTANDLDFSGPVTFTGGGSTITVNATGVVGQSSITLASVAGIAAGMTVSGGSVGAGAAVSDILANLSAANSGVVNNSTIFAGATAISTSATGTAGAAIVTVGSSSGIASGMTAVGTGVGAGAKVISVAGTVVTLSVANTSAVSGTLKFWPEKTLVKGWTLSNAGCNADAALCSAMKNVASKLSYAGSSGLSVVANGSFGSTDIVVTSASGIASGMAVSGSGIAGGAYVTGISGTTITLSASNTGAVSGIVSFDNRQILHTTSCVPAASVANAYDSVYFGLTTANRTTGAAATTTGSGSIASNQITVTSTTGILAGMSVRGSGIGNGATVTSIDSSTVLSLSVANTGIVSGTVTFAGAPNVVFRALNVGKTALP
jgi:hypothetical protein